MFQAITENTVQAGVSEQDRPREHQGRQRQEVTDHIKDHSNSLVVDQVIGPGADPGIRQITKHAEVGREKQEGVPAPSIFQSRKQKERQTE